MSDLARASRSRRWTLRQRVARASIALLVLLAALFTTVLLSLLDFRTKGDDLINRWQPAYTASQDLLADMVNQETGIRGYALGKQAAFLRPYRDYVRIERQHEAELRGYIRDRAELMSRFEQFSAVAGRWRSNFAEPLIARVQAHDPGVVATAVSDQAKAAFDEVRAASAGLTREIGLVRDQARRDRVRAISFVWAAAGASAVIILVAGIVVWRGLIRTVLDPVEELAAQTRSVARGDTSRRIAAGGPPEIAGLGRDVDEMRAQIVDELSRVERARAELAERSEELTRSNADLEQFAYVASHDLSEPLRKVANFCQLLERQYGDQLDDKAKQYIAFAVDGAKRMQVLISDLLAFSRVGRTTEEFEAVDLDEVVTRALATLDDRVVASDAQIEHDPLPTISGDPTLMAALFQNLIGNALKYRSPDRAPHIVISCKPDGDQWLFTVTDNGIGIDAQYAERIFTIFQRLHLRDQYGGTGIGLALCRKIVEFHKGRIWLGESDGPGASFQFTLPLALSGPLDIRDTVTTDEH
jgi:signal transduction histidine kinase